MSLIASVILDQAAKLSVPIIKRVIGQKLGGQNSELADTIIDAIASRAGVTPKEIPNVSKQVLESAIINSEEEAASLTVNELESQKLANDLQMAEMGKESFWAWAWRPAWMWLLMPLWVWVIVVAPLLGYDVGEVTGMLMTLTVTYLGLYMGGHTIKQVADGKK